MPDCERGECLRQLDPSELVVGTVLPGAIRDDAGRVLIRAGQTLSAAHLQQVQERAGGAAYAGPDWGTPGEVEDAVASPPGPEELVHALQRRHQSGVTAGRARQQARHEWRVPMRLIIEECGKGFLHRREIAVKTCDLSARGFAFISQQYIHVGTVIYARFITLPTRPVLKGIARNCTYLDGRRHRVGVEFLPLSPGEQVPTR